MQPNKSDSVKFPDGKVILRSLQKPLPVISHGEGIYLFDRSGKRYLDASGGAMVMSVGHGNREIVDAIQKQISQVAYVNGTQFTSAPTEELAEKLNRLARPLGDFRSLFLSSGSEAIEAAAKFARQLWVERGQKERSVFIARTPGYHGNTLYALSASGRPHYQKLFGPLLHDVGLIPSTYEYRSEVTNYQRDGAKHYAAYLEKEILKIGPKKVAGFFVEPVIGSSAGASVPPPGYFDEIQRICAQYEILIIADEVLCGSGRTGKFFASEHFGLKPDLITLGKGINGGYAPLSVLLAKQSHVEEMKTGSGYFVHAQTYSHVPSITAAGLAILNYFEEHQTLQNAERLGKFFHERLRAEISPLTHVGFVTGLGLLAGVEFVEDKTTKKPFDRTLKKVEGFIQHAFDLGLILWPNVGQADGVNGELVMLAPPLNSTEAEVTQLITQLKSAIASFFVG